MSSDPAISETSVVEENRARLALRFGWTMAEVYGRLGQPILWKRTLPKAPRLFISHFKPTSGEILWAETRRLLHLAALLFKGRDEDEDEDEDLARPALIVGLPEQMEAFIRKDAGSLPAEEDLYAELDCWSRQCWARLDAEDAILAEAASLGASLADTFWHMPPPFQESKPAPEETWNHLLHSQRLIRLIRSVRRVESYLPQDFGRMLRHSLWEWDMTQDLIRTRSGKLKIAFPLLYAFRSFNWVRRFRRWLMKRGKRQLPVLTAGERKTIWKHLQKQVRLWKRLVFDRSVEQMLRPSDWRQVRWTSRILYVLLAMVLMVGGALAFFYLVKFGQHVVVWLIPRVAPPAKFSDWLALGGTLVSVLGFLITQLRRGAEGFWHLYEFIYEWVLACKTDQRTLQAWNGKEKSTLLIALQRLMRAEDA